MEKVNLDSLYVQQLAKLDKLNDELEHLLNNYKDGRIDRINTLIMEVIECESIMSYIKKRLGPEPKPVISTTPETNV